jgi:hypothetical protein
MFELETWSQSVIKSFLEEMLGRVGRGWDGANSIAPSSSSHHSVFCVMGSATKVSGQIRLRLLYRLF